MHRTRSTLILGFVCAGAAFSQAITGSGAIGGIVRDGYGDGLPDTQILIYNDSVGVHQSITSTDDGIFRSPVLPPGSGYRLKFSRTGYVDWQSLPFTVPVGETLNFKIDLEPDATAARVSSPMVPLGTGHLALSSQIDQHQIDSLPLRQRNLDTLVLQAPAVNAGPGSELVSMSGQTAEVERRIDGIQVNPGYFTQRTTESAPPSLNVIEASQVLTAMAPAEFSNGMSGLVNSATRTGGNGFHGTAYGYFRVADMTANGRYSMGQSLLHGRNQSGATFSGPLVANKLFFMANMEVLNDHFDGLNRISNPLITNSTGTAVQSSTCTAPAAACSSALTLIRSQMNVLVPLSQRSISGFARIDYQPNEANRFSFAANLVDALSPNWQQVENATTNGGLLGIRNVRDNSRFVKASWITTPDPSATNELRVGLLQDHLFQPSSTFIPATGTAAVSLLGSSVGASNPGQGLYVSQRYQLADNFTVSNGSHTFQFGVDWARDHYYVNQSSAAGEYYYSSLTNLALDLNSTTGTSYVSYRQRFGSPARDIPSKRVGLYGQDTWKPNAKLVVNFGLRWEKPFNPQPSRYNSSYYQTASIASPYLDLAPRLGIAYSLNYKTVFRVGYGFYYAPFTGQLLDALLLGNGQTQTSNVVLSTQTGAPVFPKSISSSNIPTGTAELAYSSSKLRNPHSQQISAAIERELPANSTLSASFLSSRGYKLWTATDVNLASATKFGTYTIDDASGSKTGSFVLPIYTNRNDSNYSHIYDIENGGSSWYDALTLQYQKRMSHGLSASGSYTWSHAIDDVSGQTVVGGVPLVNSNPYYPSERGSSATDQRHRFTLNNVWQPTLTHNDSFAARYLVNGWQLSSIATFGAGLPKTASVVVNGQQFSSITPLFNTTLDGSGGTTRVPFYALSTLRTGVQSDWNLRLTRTLPISERIHGSVMFEVFNVLNRQSTTGVNTVAYTATGGVLKPVAGTGLWTSAVSYPYGTNARNCQVAFRVTF